MFNSDFFKEAGKLFPRVQDSTKASGDAKKAASTAEEQAAAAKQMASHVAAGQFTKITVTTGPDGTFRVDYSALKLKVIPGVIMQPRLAQGDAPVSIDIVGSPTTTHCMIRVRRVTSIAGLGLVPGSTGVAGVTVDVYIRPVVE